jgi:hypothetical protein
MFCPRCGSQNTETTKFCRQCGLPLQPISGYVASGGTGALAPAPPPPPPVLIEPDGLTPKQRMALTIILIILSPALLGVLAGITGMDLFGYLAGLVSILMPLGIVWTVFHYKAQMRRLQQQAFQQQVTQQQIAPPQPQPTPAFQPRSYQAPLSPPPTNPLADQRRGSVTEDETRRFPHQQG